MTSGGPAQEGAAGHTARNFFFSHIAVAAGSGSQGAQGLCVAQPHQFVNCLDVVSLARAARTCSVAWGAFGVDLRCAVQEAEAAAAVRAARPRRQNDGGHENDGDSDPEQREA